MSKKKTVKNGLHTRALFDAKMRFLLLGTLAGLVIGGIVIFIATDVNHPQVNKQPSQYHPATFVVAGKFLCGCQECQLELVRCKCGNSAGGTHELDYISMKLAEGLSEPDVVREVYKKFGSIKNAYRFLLED
ncbi:hypothetical protein GWO43_24385 [candidate division KSB1 bacterium]|nr:hypothetical protein [candidate division KSB1 bacterium]NIR69036.1 hypothetical protein [candidate division KSB1 bacterium]NIS25604.1 hypothetical protein [candidate division KSB1 bacterium]NIT73954.1 hypothetical protein [candidate division KSB1 bacterium]NIU26281.1 hypothetical protein [candidate division KSB1 bacterium]